MTTTKIQSCKELKDFVRKNRKAITRINDLNLEPVYPMLEISNKHALYYDVESQDMEILLAPFTVTFNEESKQHCT